MLAINLPNRLRTADDSPGCAAGKTGIQSSDTHRKTLRFASVKSSDVTASRNGLDLVLKINGTDEQITIQNQFTGIQPGPWRMPVTRVL